MKLGSRPDFDEQAMRFYLLNYDIVDTPDFCEKTRVLKPEPGIRYLGNRSYKVCRFCGKAESEATFRDVVHVFPESVGNKAIASYYECDACNHLFGEGIEDHYGKFFNFYHSIINVVGKNGSPKFTYSFPCDKRTDKCIKHCIKIEYVDGSPTIHICQEVNEQNFQIREECAILSMPIPKCNPIAVYKALVKMALTVMPFTELAHYKNAFEWVREETHQNCFISGKRMLIKYRFIPGFDVTQYPHFCIYSRRSTVFALPPTLFHLTYGCLSMLIEVPRDNAGATGSVVDVLFPPIPFYASKEDLWDMSEGVLQPQQKHSVVLNYSEIQEIIGST